MKKISLFIILLFSVFFAKDGMSQNLALHKPYTLSEKPNYKLSAPNKDTTSLTDGVHTTNGRFWTQKTTVGWQYLKKLTIKLDLKKAAPVGEVVLGSGAGTAGVHYPKHIYVFLSTDGENYLYAGDAAQNNNADYGTYNTQKLKLQNIDKKARWLRFVIIPKGKYLFFDEIEVLKGKTSNRAKPRQLIAVKNIDNTADSLQKYEVRHKKLLEQASSLKAFQSHKNQLRTSENQKSLSEIRESIGKKRTPYLTNKYQSEFIVEKISPWASVQSLQQIKKSSKKHEYSFSIPVHGVQYGAFLITNSTSQPSEFTFDISNSSNNLTDIELFEVPFLWSTKGEEVADPLIPVTEPIKIRPGLTKMFLFKLSGISAGKARSAITIDNGDKKFKVDLDLSVNKIFKSESGFALNTNNWGYLVYPMLKDRKQNAAKDLEAHHINTVVVPSWIMPKLTSKDFSKLIDYLNHFENIENILLFSDYSKSHNRNGYKAGQFMSSEWKRDFKSWYPDLTEAIYNNGHPKAQVYLYPYDEVRKSENIKEFENLIKWAKKNVPDIKFYATLTNEQAIQALLPLVDIGQLHYKRKEMFVDELPKSDAELWFYRIAASSRSLSPYQFYRLMAWQAFYYDFTGIGFWNYADEREGNQINSIADPISDLSGSYSVIYTGSNKAIISTRRWEAFRLGVEDYQIIQRYAQKFGRKKTLKLVDKVINNPDDFERADEVRNEMLTRLTQSH